MRGGGSDMEREPRVIQGCTEDGAGELTVRIATEAGYNKGLRAGDAERHKAHEALRKARTAGCLTESEYEARTEHLHIAKSQRELRQIVEDLPAAHAYSMRDGLRAFAKSNHPKYITLVIAILAAIAGSWAGPYSILGSSVAGNSGWIVLPVMITTMGVFGLVGSIISWADNA